MDSDGNGGWLGIDETCVDESEPGLWNGPNGEDLSAFADGGNYTYDFNVNTNTVTIDGLHCILQNMASAAGGAEEAFEHVDDAEKKLKSSLMFKHVGHWWTR